MRSYLRKLNWPGFAMMFIICALGTAANESVTNVRIWALHMVLFGLPLSLLFLFWIGRED